MNNKAKTETWVEPHRYLESNERPEVQEWLRGQAEKTEAYFQRIPVRDQLRKELTELFAHDDYGTPYGRCGRYFFFKRDAHQDMNVLYVQEGLSGTPRVLIDQNTLSGDKTTTLSSWSPSRDGKFMVYGLSKAGNDREELRVMHVATGNDLADLPIPAEGYPSFNTWNADGSGFWYTKHDPRAPLSEPKLHQRVYYHLLGSDPFGDEIVFGDDLKKEDIPSVGLSEDGHFLKATVWCQVNGLHCTKLFIKDMRKVGGNFILVLKKQPGSEFSTMTHRGQLYIRTNYNAPRWRIEVLDINEALQGRIHPTVLIPESDALVEEYDVVGNHLFVSFLHNVHTVIKQYDLNGTVVRELQLPGLGTAGGFSSEAEGNELFYSFSSFVVPPSIYRLDLTTGSSALFKKMDAGFDVRKIKTTQVWYRSKDGTTIPMFLIYKKGLAQNGNNPTLLYGYGGFDISLTPNFTSSIVPFIERDGIYAIANIRGGGEYGKEWHEAGMKTNKQNSFDDFAAAARWLIQAGYTRKERLAILGGSNGGLLTMTTITQNHDLVKAAIAQVPVTDMLRYHLFDGGVHWIPDYGNPDEPEMRKYLFGYSPYHNVRDGEKYPAVLIITSDNDDRVHPMHSYKMAARLQEANTSSNPILLRVELKAGHGGASAISKYVEQASDMWSFVFDQLGMIK